MGAQIAMIDITKVDYSAFDRDEITRFLFYPRQEFYPISTSENLIDLEIPVENGTVIFGRFHTVDKKSPVVLFFHGNGEIVSDYDSLGPLYTDNGINFLPVDYRGYGRSTGKPGVTAMMRDCHVILDYIKKWITDNGYTGSLIIMGRSLGSASALELASSYSDHIDALIVESGFALAVPLLRLLGINTDSLGIQEGTGFRNIDKIKDFSKPTLIIHAQYDNIIPFSDGVLLHEASPAKEKQLLQIPNADHNTIFAVGINAYMKAVRDLIDIII